MDNRIYKFRAKDIVPNDIENGKWVYSDEIGLDAFWAGIIDKNLNKKSLGQFTGLHDKNGVEIFEGDIVEFETLDSINNKKLKGNVYYETIGFKVMVKDLGCKEFYGDYTEVIGDIYSNPELKVAEDNQ